MKDNAHDTQALSASEQKILACVHCGLCLEACPTYIHTGDENDGPRGRIYLMRAVEEGHLPLRSQSFRNHISRCLGCRACESVCPAGVEYGQLLEAARSDIAKVARPRGLTARALNFVLRHVWSHPRRLRLSFHAARALRDLRIPRLILKTFLVRLIPERFLLAIALLEASSPSLKTSDDKKSETQIDLSKQQQRRDERLSLSANTACADLFTGCVMEGLFKRVNDATMRVLAANGCEVSAPRTQVCCGALHAHAGDLEGARRLARQNIDAFSSREDANVVTNAGGCGAMLVSYSHLLADDEAYRDKARRFSARVHDVSQQLEAVGLCEGARLDQRLVTYDASCHLIHGQRAYTQPLAMLAAIPGLRFVPLEGSDVCCGGAGVYNLLETELSGRILAEKLAHVRETGAQVLVTGNPGCHIQIAAGAGLAGMNLEVAHPVELLDESYRRAGVYALQDDQERQTQS